MWNFGLGLDHVFFSQVFFCLLLIMVALGSMLQVHFLFVIDLSRFCFALCSYGFDDCLLRSVPPVFSYKVYFLPCPSCLCSLLCVLVPWVCLQFVPCLAPHVPVTPNLVHLPLSLLVCPHLCPVPLIICPIVSVRLLLYLSLFMFIVPCILSPCATPACSQSTSSTLTTPSSQKFCSTDQHSSQAGLEGQMWYWMLLGKAAVLLFSLVSLAVKYKRG
ncbi:hypothetical protein ATANTOWER_010736 [Ataeniobius toweri]|uniref:NADH dehydrogenase subunit 6 n=1 Tax=Ataeniobius toweri TaxID=208326 RepID=A0ABU7BXV1_9TELE|nr:hypothetical protein [Ataeniobius toweri]